MEDKGVGAGTVFGIIILLAIGFLGYTFYQEQEAMTSMEPTVTGAGVPNPGFSSVEFPIEMQFKNTSEYDSPTFSADYDIYIANEKVGEGSVPSTKVMAGETKTVTQEVEVNYADVGAGVVDALKTGEFTVTIKGNVKARYIYEIIPSTEPFEKSFSY